MSPAGVPLRLLAADDLRPLVLALPMLDEDDSTVGWHVRVVPAARDMCPHRDHYAAMADDDHVIIRKSCDEFVEDGADAIAHVLV